MNPFDIGIVTIVGFCLIRGLFRGFIKELFSIIGVLGGFYAACIYYSEVTKFLSTWVSNLSYLNIISFLVIFCVVFIFINILGVIIKYLLNIVLLGWLDRIFGAGFGAVKGILIASILLMALATFLPECEPILKSSWISPKVTLVAENMANVVPKEMKRRFIAKIEECKKAWKISK